VVWAAVVVRAEVRVPILPVVVAVRGLVVVRVREAAGLRRDN
jgi:hypothetical protein